MRPSLAVSLLILSFLISQAQGIRLDKGSFMSAGHDKIKLEENGDLMKTGDKVNIMCKDVDDQDCNSGKTRKLTTINTSTSTFTTIPKKNIADPPTPSRTAKGFRREEENLFVDFPASGHHEQYPDIVDIAEMDYSPARRKPPIHN